MGSHLLLDITVREGAEAMLDDAETLATLFRGIVEEEKMTIKGEIITRFEPQGLSIVFGLTESHVSYHSYPEKEKRSCAIDFYTCKTNSRASLERIGSKLMAHFSPAICNLRIVDRILPPLTETFKGAKLSSSSRSWGLSSWLSWLSWPSWLTLGGNRAAA